jgi:hypothetical protein
MDPSLSLLKYHNSFNKSSHPHQMIIHYYINNNVIDFNKYITYDQHDDHPHMLNSFCIPISNMFTYHHALLLSNIDAVYNLLNIPNINFIKQNNKSFTYMVIDNHQNANGFVEYIQYRLPKSFGVGYLPYNQQWNYKIINAEQFKPYDGFYIDKTLKDNWKELIHDANGDIQEKYNLIICHDQNNFIIQCIIGLSCSNQHFVIYCQDVTKDINSQIIYLLSQCFTSISIIKPISMIDDGCYIICENIKNTINDDIKLLKNSVDSDQTSLYDNLLPKDFIDWLHKQVNDIKKFKYDDNQYDLTKIPLIWNLPDYINGKIINHYIS